MDFVYDTARELMKRGDLFDEANFSAHNKERYGDTEFGRHMLLGEKMLEAGVTFVKVGDQLRFGHAQQQFQRPCEPDAEVRSSLRVDRSKTSPKAQGIFDDVLVICLSEFGRTPHQRACRGRWLPDRGAS